MCQMLLFVYNSNRTQINSVKIVLTAHESDEWKKNVFLQIDSHFACFMHKFSSALECVACNWF